MEFCDTLTCVTREIVAVCVWFVFDLVSPEFSYRPGLSVLNEDSNNAASTHSGAGPPNRPLPPTPDDDDQQGDRTLIMKRVSWIHLYTNNSV